MTIIEIRFIHRIRQAMADRDANAVVSVISEALSTTGSGADSKESKKLVNAISTLLIAELNSQFPSEKCKNTIDEINAVDTEHFDNYTAGVLRILQAHFAAVNEIAFDLVLKFVNEHYCQTDFSLEMVAEFAGCSKPRMSRLFHRMTGVSYLEYVSRLRMMRAKELLEQTDMRINDVFGAVGYLDAVNARKKFTTHYGITPSAYRTQFQNTSDKQD